MEGVNEPWGITLNSKQQLVVAQHAVKKVTVLDKNCEKVQTVTCAKFSEPNGVAVDKEDNIYVSDRGSHSVFKFSKEGELLKVVGHKGNQPGEFNDLSMMKIINDKLYICDRGNNRIQVMNTQLEYMNGFGCHGNRGGEFNYPNDIAQDGAGNLYVSDCRNHRVQVFDCNGQFLFAFSKRGASKPLRYPYGICIDFDQFVYVCDWGNNCVSVFMTSGEFVTSFGQFSWPTGIVIDDDGFVYVADYGKYRIDVL